MKDFKFSYDEESDDLFIYLDGAKSSGAVEIGDFVIIGKDINKSALNVLFDF